MSTAEEKEPEVDLDDEVIVILPDGVSMEEEDPSSTPTPAPPPARPRATASASGTASAPRAARRSPAQAPHPAAAPAAARPAAPPRPAPRRTAPSPPPAAPAPAPAPGRRPGPRLIKRAASVEARDPAPSPAQHAPPPVIAVEPLGVEVAAMSVRLSWAAGILIAGLLAVLFAAGWRYYLTPPVRRPFHFQHELLRPSGVIGLSLGVVGTAIIIASLAYSLRKRFVSWSRVGSLRGWLAWHILAGLVGPALIVFHSSFAPSSAVALLAFGAMWVVVASGFAGRFIYVRLPKAVDGRELELEDVRHRVAHYRRTLMDLGVDESLLPTAELPARRREWLWLFRAAGAVLWGDRAARRDFDRIRAAISASGYTGPTWDQALLLARRLCEARQWLARHREMRKLMAAWRFFHGWFVTILLAGILFHVAIAVRYGGLWLLGGRQG